MTSELYRAPADCPVCGKDLIIIRKGCTHCGSELAGEFTSSPYDRLDAAEHELLRVFLTSRGNLREVEKHLQVSYPTARARFDALLVKLGMNPDTPPAPPQSDESATAGHGETKTATRSSDLEATFVMVTEIVRPLGAA